MSKLVLFFFSSIFAMLIVHCLNEILTRFFYNVSTLVLCSFSTIMCAITVCSLSSTEDHDFPLLRLVRRKSYWFEKTVYSTFFRVLSFWNPPSDSMWYLLVFGGLTLETLCFIESVGPTMSVELFDFLASKVWTFGSNKILHWRIASYVFVIGVHTLRDFRGRRRDILEIDRLEDELNELNRYLRDFIMSEMRVKFGMSNELKRVRRELSSSKDSYSSILKDNATLTNENACLQHQLRLKALDYKMVRVANGALISEIKRTRGKLKILNISFAHMEDKCKIAIENLRCSLEDMRIEVADTKDVYECILAELRHQIIAEVGDKRKTQEEIHVFETNSSSPTSDNVFNSDKFLKTRKLREAEEAARGSWIIKEKQTYGREFRVFETTSSPASTSASNTDEPEDFFEFTAEDYYRVIATKKEDKFVKTKKLREAEEAARGSRITKAVIRVRFPDNHTLEATFHPSETIQSLIDLLMKVVARPDLPFLIYTTPPKKQFKDTSQNFYAAGFVPGAIVYFSYDLPKGPFLREEVMSLKGLEQEQPEPAPETTVSEPPVEERKPATDKKTVKPKWFKSNIARER